MHPHLQLAAGQFYHVYNRGVNSCNLFRSDANSLYFLQKLAQYVLPVSDIYAYCLCYNHFHLLLRCKDAFPIIGTDPQGNQKQMNPSTQLGHLFNSYAQAFNKQHKRTGPLFESPFERKSVNDSDHLTWLIWYIHSNPQRHQLIADFHHWKWCSYKHFIAGDTSLVAANEVVNWFGSLEKFVAFHDAQHQELIDLMIE